MDVDRAGQMAGGVGSGSRVSMRTMPGDLICSDSSAGVTRTFSLIFAPVFDVVESRQKSAEQLGQLGTALAQLF